MNKLFEKSKVRGCGSKLDQLPMPNNNNESWSQSNTLLSSAWAANRSSASQAFSSVPPPSFERSIPAWASSSSVFQLSAKPMSAAPTHDNLFESGDKENETPRISDESNGLKLLTTNNKTMMIDKDDDDISDSDDDNVTLGHLMSLAELQSTKQQREGKGPSVKETSSRQHVQLPLMAKVHPSVVVGSLIEVVEHVSKSTKRKCGGVANVLKIYTDERGNDVLDVRYVISRSKETYVPSLIVTQYDCNAHHGEMTERSHHRTLGDDENRRPLNASTKKTKKTKHSTAKKMTTKKKEKNEKKKVGRPRKLRAQVPPPDISGIETNPIDISSDDEDDEDDDDGYYKDDITYQNHQKVGPPLPNHFNIKKKKQPQRTKTNHREVDYQTYFDDLDHDISNNTSMWWHFNTQEADLYEKKEIAKGQGEKNWTTTNKNSVPVSFEFKPKLWPAITEQLLNRHVKVTKRFKPQQMRRTA
jgi:hypothetical protein